MTYVKKLSLFQKLALLWIATLLLTGAACADPNVFQPLAPAQLSSLSALQLSLLRNEIYARHGYQFVGTSPRSAMLRQHFGALSWYHPDTPDSTVVQARLSPTERHNVDAIVRAEQGKPQDGLPSSSPTSSSAPIPGASPVPVNAPVPSPSGDVSPLVPDPALTPGATLPVTVADIAVPGYTKKVRNVPQSVKEQVYAEYGITHRQPYEYEVDHLISLELGGSNSIKNLWPQSYKTQPWNARVKDRLENRLHALVVSGQMSLPDAQHEIATDWIGAYKKQFGSDLPVTKAVRAARPVQAAQNVASIRHAARSSRHPHLAKIVPDHSVKVWVNTKTGVYHFPGERWYGATQEGEFMSEDAAKKAGYRGTENGQ